MLTNLKRVFKFALMDFYRNKGISIATIFVLVVTTILITGLFYLQGISSFLVSEVQNKIDITAYFTSDAPEESILVIKDQILAMSPDIKSVQYVSKEDALENFTKKHQDNAVFSNALAQVGDNPFLPSLNIMTTGNPLQYQQVADVLQSDKFNQLVERVDYSEKKDTIEKVFYITRDINNYGLVTVVILVILAILVVLNTIKLAIDSSKEEITTMRMVGASSWFVRAPFIIQGILFGSISFVICFVFTLLLSYLLSSKLAFVMPGFSLSAYFIKNLWLIILIQFGFGAGLGALSSIIVVNKYLKM